MADSFRQTPPARSERPPTHGKFTVLEPHHHGLGGEGSRSGRYCDLQIRQRSLLEGGFPELNRGQEATDSARFTVRSTAVVARHRRPSERCQWSRSCGVGRARHSSCQRSIVSSPVAAGLPPTRSRVRICTSDCPYSAIPCQQLPHRRDRTAPDEAVNEIRHAVATTADKNSQHLRTCSFVIMASQSPVSPSIGTRSRSTRRCRHRRRGQKSARV